MTLSPIKGTAAVLALACVAACVAACAAETKNDTSGAAGASGAGASGAGAAGAAGGAIVGGFDSPARQAGWAVTRTSTGVPSAVSFVNRMPWIDTSGDEMVRLAAPFWATVLRVLPSRDTNFHESSPMALIRASAATTA